MFSTVQGPSVSTGSDLNWYVKNTTQLCRAGLQQSGLILSGPLLSAASVSPVPSCPEMVEE